jgi:uncharacterized protein YlxW (UPF0749 family)
MKPMSVNHDKASSTQRFWLWQVTALALFLGAILGASLRAQENFRRNNIFPNRTGVPVVEYGRQLKRNNDLQAEIERLNQVNHHLTESYSGSAKLETLKNELRNAKAFAALTPVSGPGVIVTLADLPPAKAKSMGVTVDQSIVHDVDVLQAINELRATGAEAISINGERLAAASPIRCVGNSILVNTVPKGQPFELSAVGDQRTMYSGLTMNGGIMDPQNSTLALLNMISIRKASDLRIPAYSGSTVMKHSKPRE